MTHDLVVLHRRGSERFEFADSSANSNGALVQSNSWFAFKTCMRHILVGDMEDLASIRDQLRVGEDEVHVGEDAYRFVLQVICGLHSPLIGETEVYGQFKNAVAAFDAPVNPTRYKLTRFFRSLFEDAKKIRQTHLEDLGSQSYGSILRRELKERRCVHVLGAGHLVQEILPWIAKDGTEIHVHCRNPEKARNELGAMAEKVILHSHAERDALADVETVIIAAPVSAQWIADWMPKDASPRLIVDLRSNSNEDRLLDHERVLSLNELLQRITSNQAMLLARKRAALAAVDVAVADRSRHVENRPFGWEDVCA